jgi:hypothetical protein
MVTGGDAGRAIRSALVADATVGGAAQADVPGALADFEFAETGGTELGHEGGQEAGGQAVDGGVIGGSFGRAALHATVIRRSGHLRVPGMR